MNNWLRTAPLLALGLSANACSESSHAPGAVIVAAAETGVAPPVGTPPADAATEDAVVDSSASDTDSDASMTGACPKGYSEVPTTAVTYPKTTDGELLAAMTWDERTMAWTTNQGGVITVHYADRSDRDVPFTSAWTLPSSLGPFPEDKIALTSDGRTALVMSADHQSIRQISRSARGMPFDPSTMTTAPFTRLTGVGAGTVPRQLADLVLSKDGNTLFYTDLLRTTGATLRMSNRLPDGSWDTPNMIGAARLVIDGGDRCRPTGLSADGNTLFLFEEATGSALVAFRDPGTTNFVEFYAYAPTGRRAMPSETCSRVYLNVVKPDVLPFDAGGDGDLALDAGPGGPPEVFTIVHAP